MSVVDVLDGRIHADVDDLLDLIDDVNPTGKELPAAETRRRYTEKSALQSLLVRIHPDDIAVETDPGDGDVVLLRHRFSGRDACHAVIDELEPDARSWVRLQLDTADDGEPAAQATRAKAAPIAAPIATPSDDRPHDPASLIRRGRKLMEEYDYEEARACFEEAVRQTGGAEAAALPLLELLVDHLAANDDALAIASDLPKAVIQSREARVLLALAASRTGQLGQAERYMSGLTDVRLAEVQLALAGAAIRERRFPKAREYLERARELDPGDAGIIEREREVSRTETSAMTDGERELEQVVALEGLAATEDRARELLRRWPGSQVGRRILGEIDERRRASELEAVKRQAEEALSQGALEEAISLWRRTIPLGGDPVLVSDKIRAAEIEKKEQELTARTMEVFRLLQGNVLDTGLKEYLQLDPELQAMIKTVLPLRHLVWLSAINVGPGKADLERAVSAVCELGRAILLQAGGQSEAAARILSPYVSMLGAIPEAQLVLDNERLRIKGLQLVAMQSTLAAIGEARDSGDIAFARRLITSVNRSLLPVDLQDRIDHFDSELRTVEETLGGLTRIEALVSSGDLLRARDEATRTMANSDSGEQALWRDLVRDLNDKIKKEWRQVVLVGPDAKDTGSEYDKQLFSTNAFPAALFPDGQHVLVVRARGEWLFFRIFELTTSSIAVASALRTPVVWDPTVRVDLDGEIASVWDDACHLLEINLSTWEIQRWSDFRFLFSMECPINHVARVPSGRHAWVTIGSTPDPVTNHPKTHVVDLDSLKVVSELKLSPMYTDQVPSKPPKMVAAYSDKLEIALHQERGKIDRHEEIPGVLDMFSVRAIDNCRRFAVAARMEFPDRALHVFTWAPGGQIGKPFHLRDSNCELRHFTAWSESKSLLFVTYMKNTDEAFLSALRLRNEDLAEGYRIAIPGESRLIWDANRHCVVLVTGSLTRINMEELGESPPRFSRSQKKSLPSATKVILTNIRERIVEYDRKISAGKIEDAILVLDHSLIFRTRESQSFARLAAAYLKRHSLTPGADYRKALVLADYTASDWVDDLNQAHRIDLGDERWSNERLREISLSAAEWLGAWQTAGARSSHQMDGALFFKLRERILKRQSIQDHSQRDNNSQ